MRVLVKSGSVILFLVLSTAQVIPQINQITFGEIPREDFEMKVYSEDPAADAVVLEDYADVRMELRDGIKVLVDRHVRIKIINNDGLRYANIEISFGHSDKITGMKAASYILEGEELTTTPLDRKSFYTEETTRYFSTLRFSMPNVRVGSVIEYKYTLESDDYFSLYTMEFQKEIPVRRTGLMVEFPGYFTYKFVRTGDFSRIKYSSREESVSFGHNFVNAFKGLWTAYNIPAYRIEKYSTGSDDYHTTLGFELSQIEVPGYYFEEISPTYPRLSTKLLEMSDFGSYMRNNLGIVKKAQQLTANCTTDTEKLKKIYSYVTENFVWDGIPDITANYTMAKVISKGRGNAAELNLMLVAMLKACHVAAEPVILSTRENGRLNTFFAILQKLDYVVAVVRADGNQYLVDATDPLRPFDMLPFECLNGEGWTVTSSAGSWVDVKNDEHYGVKSGFELNLKDDGTVSGKVHNTYESYSAYQVRKVCELNGIEGYTDQMRAANGNWKISGFTVDKLEDINKPVDERFDLEIPFTADISGDLIYLNPAIGIDYSQNNFPEDERISPIDFGCPSSLKVVYKISVPEGYTIESVPLPAKMQIAGGGSAFSYEVQTLGNNVVVVIEKVRSSTRFAADQYYTLREYEKRINQKLAEMIVIKRPVKAL